MKSAARSRSCESRAAMARIGFALGTALAFAIFSGSAHADVAGSRQLVVTRTLLASALRVAAQLRRSWSIPVSARLVGAYVGVAFGAALVAWLLSRLRRKGHWTTSPEAAMPASSATLAQNLTELAELHRAGSLSDEEFARAKNKLLSAP